ncbi:hypothetical protein ACWF7H_25495 [Peribacillus butanolivorans]|uniref:hypothetical protein n=1 Tax=Peribacillus butanolivorans TaxID=421767 RepID=UPI0036CE9FE9
MDKEQEESIVKAFFEKRIKERVLFELFSSKRREDALHRLNHNYKETLREEYMIEIQKPNSNPIEISKILKKHGAGNQCYVISFNEEIDGKELPLLTALEHAVGYGFPSIVSCIPNNLAYFEAEQVYGAPPRYILKRKY